jgi:hypothetical protein
VQPGNSLHRQIPHFPVYAADNGCFAQGADFDERSWLSWLAGLPRTGCLFATAPDVLGDAEATWRRSRRALSRIRRLGFPAALVAQDGFDAAAVDWRLVDVLFLGGSTDFKVGPAGAGAAAAARARGVPVHMGRVNSARRVRLAADFGCSSVDGTFLKHGPDRRLPEVLQWLEGSRPPTLWDLVS